MRETSGYYRLCWALWLVGTALIVLNWNHVVGREVRWTGFGIAFVGACMSFFAPAIERWRANRANSLPPQEDDR